MASKLIYVLVALVVLLAYLGITNKVIEDKRHLEAMGAFKGYVEQARATIVIKRNKGKNKWRFFGNWG